MDLELIKTNLLGWLKAITSQAKCASAGQTQQHIAVVDIFKIYGKIHALLSPVRSDSVRWPLGRKNRLSVGFFVFKG
ncbi:MAG TPA: hypothetical protein DIT33_24920 [Pseudomonas sp.]|nr:hypothetical protein [Pseudomonas sp.]